MSHQVKKDLIVLWFRNRPQRPTNYLTILLINDIGIEKATRDSGIIIMINTCEASKLILYKFNTVSEIGSTITYKAADIASDDNRLVAVIELKKIINSLKNKYFDRKQFTDYVTIEKITKE